MYRRYNELPRRKNITIIMILLISLTLLLLYICKGDETDNKGENEIPEITIEEVTEEITGDDIIDDNDVEDNVSDTYSPTDEDEITDNEEDIIYPEIEEEIWVSGYTTANLNVRSECNTDSEILTVLPEYSEISFRYIEDNDEWVEYVYNDNTAYLYKSYVEEGLPYVVKSATGDTRKSYMDWKKITNKSSLQWKLQHKYAYTESNGVRAVNGRYCIALGSYYTHSIGQYVDVVLENGLVIPCIVGDAKQDIHTLNNHSIGLDGGVVEFIVNTKSLSSIVRTTGDVSYVSEDWKSNVVEIRIYYKNLFD